MAAKQDRGRQTIEQLLKSALDIFAEDRADGFTITAVVARSGVSVGSLYHHFGNFDGLAATLYSRCIAQIMDAVLEALRRTRTARTGIEAMARAYLQWSLDNRTMALILHTAEYSEYRAPAQVSEAKAPRLKEIAEWMAPHIEAGRVQPLPPHIIEMLLIGPLALAVSRWLEGVPNVDLNEAIKILPERVWPAVKGPNG